MLNGVIVDDYVRQHWSGLIGCSRVQSIRPIEQSPAPIGKATAALSFMLPNFPVSVIEPMYPPTSQAIPA